MSKSCLTILFTAWAAWAFAQQEPSWRAFSSPDPQARAEAVKALADLPADVKWHDLLLASLADRTPSVRLEALKTFVKVGRDYYDLRNRNTFLYYSPSWNPGIIDRLLPMDTDSDIAKTYAIKSLIKLWDDADTLYPFRSKYRCAVGMRTTLRFHISQALDGFSKKHPSIFKSLSWDEDLDYVYGALTHYPDDLWEDHGKRVDQFIQSHDKRRVVLGIFIAAKAPPEQAFQLLKPLQSGPEDGGLKLLTTLLLGTREQALIELAQTRSEPAERRLKAIRFLTGHNEVLKELLNDPDRRIAEEARKVLAIKG